MCRKQCAIRSVRLCVKNVGWQFRIAYNSMHVVYFLVQDRFVLRDCELLRFASSVGVSEFIGGELFYAML
jgi:hypothetical protein